MLVLLNLFFRLFNLFDLPINDSFINFDAYEDYFFDIEVPKRIHSLEPYAKIIIFLMEPKLASYSCYQVI